MNIEHELTTRQLQAAYKGGLRKFSNTEIIVESGNDLPALLTDIDLQGSEFSNCWFHSAIFRHVNLSNVKFDLCNLKLTTFENCDLSGSIWKECAVCAIAVAGSNTEAIQVSEVTAYGESFEDVEYFLEHALNNGKSNRSGASEV